MLEIKNKEKTIEEKYKLFKSNHTTSYNNYLQKDVPVAPIKSNNTARNLNNNTSIINQNQKEIKIENYYQNLPSKSGKQQLSHRDNSNKNTSFINNNSNISKDNSTINNVKKKQINDTSAETNKYNNYQNNYNTYNNNPKNFNNNTINNYNSNNSSNRQELQKNAEGKIFNK